MCTLTEQNKQKFFQNPEWGIEQLNICLQNKPDNVELLLLKAQILESLDKIPDAINTLILALKFAENKTEILVKIEFLKTILRYRNLDIYASTNTWQDPWLD